MKKILFCLILLACPFSYADDTLNGKKMPDYSGIYALLGKEKDDNYVGTMIIKHVGENTYIIDIAGPGNHSRGIGYQKEKHFFISWQSVIDPGIIGYTYYQIDGKNLTGHWTLLQKKMTLQRERAVWLRNLDTDKDT